ncbi:hypothetical protein FBU31_004533 [Coemansia sp. 'formosensis']|nr:hypothetical protein FBU31_004533 [Coemansia sp. 'formosensis']
MLTPTDLLNVYGAADNEPKETVSKASSVVVISSVMFANIFGKSVTTPATASTTAVNAHVHQAMRLVCSAVHSTYVNAPYHVLPPVLVLYDQFVAAQMHPTTTDAFVPPTSNKDEGDAVMADADIEKEASVTAVVN